MDIQAAITEFGDGIEQFKAKYNSRLDDEIKHREELERKLNRLQVGGNAAVTDYEAKADNKKLREFFSGKEQKAMTVGADPEGGYTVLPYFSSQLTKIIREQNPLRKLARVVQITGDQFEEVEDLSDLEANWVGETSSRPETTAPTVGKLTIRPHEIYAAPKVSQQLLDDSMFDIASWLAGKIGDKIARSETLAMTTGDGVARPRGFTTYTTAATADDSRTWGQIEHVVTGASGSFHTTQADPLFDMVAALRPAYRNGAAWQMPRRVAATISKFKTTGTGEYIWQPGLTEDRQDMLLGFPVYLNEDIPAMSSGSLSCWFGNWKLGYTIVDRIAVRLMQDPYTAKPYVIFYAYRRVGGGVANFEALKALKFST